MLDLSNLLLDTGESLMAVACLKRLTDREPENANAWQNLGVAYFHETMLEEGLAASHRAVKCDPLHLMAMYNLAVAFEQMRNYDSAMDWIQRGLAIDPREPAFLKLEVRLRLLKFGAVVGRICKSVLRIRGVSKKTKQN